MSDSIILFYYHQRRPSSILHRDPSIVAHFARRGTRLARFKRMKKHPHPFLPFVLMNFANDRDIFPFQPRRGYFPIIFSPLHGFWSCARNIYGSIGAERFAARTLLPAFVRPSVRPSIHLSIHPSIHPSIRLRRNLKVTSNPVLITSICASPCPSFSRNSDRTSRPKFSRGSQGRAKGERGLGRGGGWWWNRAESGSGPSLFGLFPVCSPSPSLRFSLPVFLSLSPSRSSSYRRLRTYPFFTFPSRIARVDFPGFFRRCRRNA